MSEYFGKFAIITAPEAKIFQPHLQDALLENPARIFEMEDVPIYVERACGRIEFRLGRPRVFFRPQTSDKSEELNFLVEWLTGGDDGKQCQETESYGVVKLCYDEHIERAVMEGFMGALNGGVPVMSAETVRAQQDEMERAKRKSRDRVMSAIRRVYANYRKQIEQNKEAGGASLNPTKTELLCHYVLRKEIAAEKERQDRINAQINDTLESDPFAVDSVMMGSNPSGEPEKVKKTRKPRKAKEDGIRSDEVLSGQPE